MGTSVVANPNRKPKELLVLRRNPTIQIRKRRQNLAKLPAKNEEAPARSDGSPANRARTSRIVASELFLSQYISYSISGNKLK
jgi:hypothetical protein